MQKMRIDPAQALARADRIEKNIKILDEKMTEIMNTVKSAQQSGAVTAAHMRLLDNCERLYKEGFKNASEDALTQVRNIRSIEQHASDYSNSGAK